MTLHRGNRRRGSALIEAAFVLPMFGLLVFSSVDLTKMLNGTQIAAAAARAGVHRALLPGADLSAVEAAAVAGGGSGVSARASKGCACSAEAKPADCEAVRCVNTRAAYVHVATRVELNPFLRLPGMVLPTAATGDAWVRVE